MSIVRQRFHRSECHLGVHFGRNIGIALRGAGSRRPLASFAACGRGQTDTASLLSYYGVPLLITTDDGFVALASDDQIVAALQQQVDGMRGGWLRP